MLIVDGGAGRGAAVREGRDRVGPGKTRQEGKNFLTAGRQPASENGCG